MVLGGHRQVVLVRPADTTLVLHVLHYPEHVRVCPQTVWPLKQEPEEELRLAGMLIDAAVGKVDWTAYPDQTAQKRNRRGSVPGGQRDVAAGLADAGRGGRAVRRAGVLL